MTDSQTPPVEVVRGEIQPWTDYANYRRPAGGPVLLALLDDLLPASAGRVLIAGPHGREVIELAATRTERLTVLVRSVGDAEDLRAAVPAAHVTVIAGALDGMPDAEPFDVIIAADGLDRVLGYDSPALNWPQRNAELFRLAAPGALVVVGAENEFALTGLYDRRPLDARHGDDEWRPLHDDPDRPTSPAQLTAVLGDRVTTVYAAFDEAGTVHTLLGTDAAARTRPGRPGARLAVTGLAATAAQLPVLASTTEGAEAAARAGLLASVAPGWLAVVGGPSAHAAYAASGGGVLVGDLSGESWSLTVRPAEGQTPSGIAFDPALVPSALPDTEAVETLLFRLAAAEDVPGFRALAGRVGAWADASGLILLDDLQLDGTGFARGVTGWRAPAGTGTPELLAAAWHRFRDRLIHAHRRHPWPPWMADKDDLVSTWLGMSGVDATPAVLARGREIADLLAGKDPAEPDLRTILADAENDKLKVKELGGQIFGLERTMRFRDQQLRTREQQIRRMRDELRGIKGSRAMKLAQVARKAAKIRDPKNFAKAVKRRLVR